MSIAAPSLFDTLESKLGWVESRQRVLAQNIANADTPGYRARDIKAFSAQLSELYVEPARTSPMHLAGFTPHAASRPVRFAERAPDGNAVNLEDQMTKVADDENTQALTSNLWKSYMGMFMTALGHG